MNKYFFKDIDIYIYIYIYVIISVHICASIRPTSLFSDDTSAFLSRWTDFKLTCDLSFTSCTHYMISYLSITIILEQDMKANMTRIIPGKTMLLTKSWKLQTIKYKWNIHIAINADKPPLSGDVLFFRERERERERENKCTLFSKCEQKILFSCSRPGH